jgi:hypothetical protein
MDECPRTGLPEGLRVVEVVANPDTVAGDAIPNAADVTERLDQVYENEPSALEPDVRNALRRTLARSSW